VITLKEIIRDTFYIEKLLLRSTLRMRGQNRERCFVFRKSDFAKEKNKRSRLIWQKQGRDVFLSCPGCGGINRLMLGHEGYLNYFSVTSEGFVGAYERHCITCPLCKVHFGAKLKDWKEDE
jgi:hypothetical protein